MIEFIVGAVIALISSFLYGKKQGKDKVNADDLKEKIKSVEKAKNVEKKINEMDDDSIRVTAGKWVRNKDN